MSKSGWRVRDVSLLLQKLREFLLGRSPHNLHARFPQMVSPRTIPPPDIPRGPDDNYANRYYYMRNAIDSVRPPVVAPVAEGLQDQKKKFPADSLCFTTLPTPGPAWWWDGHCYYECIDEPPAAPPAVASSCPPPNDDKSNQTMKTEKK